MSTDTRKAKILPTMEVVYKKTGESMIINEADFNSKDYEKPAKASTAKKESKDK